MLFRSEIYSVPEAVYRSRLERFDEVLGLGDILPVTGRKLSLGQRVRADLAAALLHRPSVLYLDEPTIGLDVAVKERVRAFLRSLGDEGITVMLTSHDLQDIEDVCRRLVIIDAGRIIFDGDLAALKDEFAKERVLRLETAEPIDSAALAALLPACEVTAGEHTRAVTVRFDRFTTAAGQIVSAVGTLAELTDFQVEEPSIEDVIRRVYAGELLAGAGGRGDGADAAPDTAGAAPDTEGSGSGTGTGTGTAADSAASADSEADSAEPVITAADMA